LPVWKKTSTQRRISWRALSSPTPNNSQITLIGSGYA
jgi:hypothetical protein